ncbi:MAG: TrkA family potassium uptake protein [bacterium]|nr:MAG: TrkA family potassium uptake protein [bacterium]
MKRFCVIGLGNFGFHVASELYREGHEVLAIDVDRERIQRIKDHCSVAVLGDAANKEFLAAQGVSEMDAVIVSTGERSHLSTLITLFLKELEVKHILVKALNDDHGRILKKVGAEEVIHPEKDMAAKTARALAYPNILDFVPLAEDYSITEAAPPPGYIGKDLITLDLRRRYQVTIIAIKDIIADQFIIAPAPDYIIKDSDLLIFMGRSEDIERALKNRK